MAYPVTVNWREHGEAVVVDSPEQLSRLLDRIAAEADAATPPLVLIDNERGTLTIGIGAVVSTLNHVPPSGDPPYLICVGADERDEVVDFYYFGHHSQFAVRNTVSNEVAKSAALAYSESGTLPNEVAWEPV